MITTGNIPALLQAGLNQVGAAKVKKDTSAKPTKVKTNKKVNQKCQ